MLRSQRRERAERKLQLTAAGEVLALRACRAQREITDDAPGAYGRYRAAPRADVAAASVLWRSP